ncbi:MAG: symmetrical bis(5'-nucleosyl)-tetraphosphatase [Methylococcaceae bacterium]|nr:symmetrical bis(5'-nucleosyl)-tetraphosphatase [Methylococcaceae bacterium]
MSVYAIGDLQGCYEELLRLLDVISFDQTQDQLWFAGDLVNRGPNSLETLRFVKSLGNSAVVVLGNHDLHLLAAFCQEKKSEKKNSLHQVLEAPDCDELMHWLRHRPLFHYQLGFCMVHAGLPPQWDFAKTVKMARKAEAVLRGAGYRDFLKQMYGDKPNRWSAKLKGTGQIRFSINCFTRMRYCDKDGSLDFDCSGAPGTQPKHLIPWFQMPERKSAAMKIIFGHWSALGYYAGDNCYGIDTGCLWGGQLTALKLGDSVERFSIDCEGYKKPSLVKA